MILPFGTRPLSDGEMLALFDLADDPDLNYDAGQFDLLKQIHDASGGSQTIDGWCGATPEGLVAPLGLSGGRGTTARSC